MRISDWSSDVCSSDLFTEGFFDHRLAEGDGAAVADGDGEAFLYMHFGGAAVRFGDRGGEAFQFLGHHRATVWRQGADRAEHLGGFGNDVVRGARGDLRDGDHRGIEDRSEENTSELQSLMRHAYAV